MRVSVGITVFVALGLAPAVLASAERSTIRLQLNGEHLEGLPLKWTTDRVFLLSRDGRLLNFRPKEASDLKRVSSNFYSYSQGEMRADLAREFRGRLEVSATGHFLVAHPPGQSRWAERFEQLYRSFVHYFTVRGLPIKDPEFPLVAVVWGKRADFARYAATHGDPVIPGVLGYYSNNTNRIVMYDQGDGKSDDTTWRQNAAVIVHEAAHQSAFNTGIHSRFGSPPRWLVEGLGTLFEAPGVWDSYHYGQRSDRINRNRLAQFKQWLTSGRTKAAFADLIASDKLFQQNVGAAYAESWAFTFFLTETQPQKYGEYLERTAARPAFKTYSSAQRMADFTALFGRDMKMLDADFLRFIDSLR